MKKPIAVISTIMFILLSFVSCVAKPNEIEREGIIKAQNKGEQLLDDYLNSSSQTNSNNTDSHDSVSLSSELQNTSVPSEHIKKTFKGNSQSLTVNADIINSDKVNQSFFRYKIIDYGFSEEQREKIKAACFGENLNKVVEDNGYLQIFDPETGLATQQCQIGNSFFSWESFGQNLYPFDDGAYRSVNDSNCSLNLDEAIALCVDFLNQAEINGYYRNSIKAYGRGGKHPYYKVNYTASIDGFPVVGNDDVGNLYFLIDENGIQKVQGMLYGLEKQNSYDSIIPVDVALDILGSGIDSLSLNLDEGHYLLENHSDDSQHLTDIPIAKIQLEYGIFTNDMLELYVEPVWRFFVGEDDSTIDHDIILTVNAINGKVSLKTWAII